MAEKDSNPSSWVYWTAAALTLSLAHVIIDFHIGLYGETSPEMTFLQASNLFVTSLVYGWWVVIIVLGFQGNKSAILSALIMIIAWAVLWNGLIGIFVAPPPSAAYPYQDIAHFGTVILGGIGSYRTRSALQDVKISASWYLPLATTVLLVGTFVVQSVLGLMNL
ncbi:MAG: hypothetical protein QNJ45_16275 [Ardenticatenaceae bacterium]|nr:hypothetical protein [Ardenticatenaceae bacterium]